MWSGLVQVTTADACFGLVVVDGIVVDCAPYGRRTCLGRPIAEVAAVWRRHGAVVVAC